MSATYEHYRYDLKKICEGLSEVQVYAKTAFFDAEPNSHERAFMMYVKPQIDKLLKMVEKELYEE